jgi:hypothetical protein
LIIETLAVLIGLAASTGSFFYGVDGLMSEPSDIESVAAPSADAERSAPDPLMTPFIRPSPNASPTAASVPKPEKVNWTGILAQELRFLAIEHGFRVATEAGTRDGGFGLGKSYWNSVFNLHGWADGDPFYVNYVGHPMNGAVAGYIWQQNDPRYRNTEFGRDPAYWKAKLRGAAFAWAQSEQFEIGPFSEASIGKVHPKRTVRDRTFQRGLDRQGTVASTAIWLRRPCHHTGDGSILDAGGGLDRQIRHQAPGRPDHESVDPHGGADDAQSQPHLR